MAIVIQERNISVVHAARNIFYLIGGLSTATATFSASPDRPALRIITTNGGGYSTHTESSVVTALDCGLLFDTTRAFYKIQVAFQAIDAISEWGFASAAMAARNALRKTAAGAFEMVCGGVTQAFTMVPVAARLYHVTLVFTPPNMTAQIYDPTAQVTELHTLAASIAANTPQARYVRNYSTAANSRWTDIVVENFSSVTP